MRRIQRQMGGPTQDEMKIELIGDENLVALLALRNASKAELPIDLRSICERLGGEPRDMALKSLESLEAKSLEDIRADYTALKAKRGLAAHELKERGRSFNQSCAMADFEHWAKMASWTIDEAIALSLSRDPRSVAWTSVQAYTNVSDLAKSFQDRRQIAHSAVKTRQLYASNTPAAFLAWARDQVRLELPDMLISEVESLGYTIANWKTLYDGLLERHGAALKEQGDGWKTLLDDTLKAKNAMIEGLVEEIKRLQGEPENQLQGVGMSKGESESLHHGTRAVFHKIIYVLSREDKYKFSGKPNDNSVAKKIEDALLKMGVEANYRGIQSKLEEAYKAINDLKA